jgi:hypothetical protein
MFLKLAGILVKKAIGHRKQQVGGLAVSGGLFAGANALSSMPELALTPEMWDFIYWAIGALLIGANKKAPQT